MSVAVQVERIGVAWARIEAWLPALFLLLALAGGLSLAWNLPPYQGADEPAHVYRADMITVGDVVGERVPDERTGLAAGGKIDEALPVAAAPFSNIAFDTAEKADVADYAQAANGRWNGRTMLGAFPGSAIYPPLLYLPHSVGLALGKLLKLPVVQSIVLARAAGAIVCALLGAAALSLLRRSRAYAFTLLLLPMSLALFATVTNDGMMIVLTALAVGLVARADREERPLSLRELSIAGACFALIGLTKAPYAFLSLVLLYAPRKRRRAAVATVALVILVSFGWSAWMSAAVQTATGRVGFNIDPHAQLQFLLSHPLAVFPIALTTLKNFWGYYAVGFVGSLGWNDTFLPAPYYPLAYAMLVLAGLTAVGRGVSLPLVLLSLLAVVAVIGLIHAGLYLVWTTVGGGWVEGVQGRYLLPPAVVLALALESRRPLLPETGRWAAARAAAMTVVAAFPLISLLLVERALIVRYYLD